MGSPTGFDRFWSGLLQYAAEPPYAIRRGAVGLDVDRAAAQPGEPLRIRARLPLAEFPLAGNPRLRVVRDGQTVRTLPMARAGPEDSGRFELTLRGLDEGDYALQLEHESAPQDPPLELPVLIHRSHEDEMRVIAADPALLQRIAQISDGQFLTLEQAPRLSAQLDRERAERHERTSHALWQSPLLFLFVLGCLGLEWALRKRAGLV
jgi:hypothetical protein